MGQLLDPIPVYAVFLLFALTGLAAYEGGYRLGRWWQGHTPDEKEGPSGVLIGSLLAIMGFLLAVTMGMALERYDTRRQLVLDEANAIGTVYQRAGYLPQPASDQTRALLREYAPLRVDTADGTALLANYARSGEIDAALWSIAEPLARELPESQMLALYISALGDLIDLEETRLTSLQYDRVPETIVWLMFLGSAITLGMFGFHAGLHRRRSFIGALALIVVLGAVVTLVVDLDRPRRGFVQVPQQPLLDVIEQIGPPAG